MVTRGRTRRMNHHHHNSMTGELNVGGILGEIVSSYVSFDPVDILFVVLGPFVVMLLFI